MGNMIEPIGRYETLKETLLNNNKILGIVADDSLILRNLVQLAMEIKEIDQIADLILANLAGIWTFNHKGLEDVENFPKSLGRDEASRWAMITKKNQKLSNLLRRRIGNCATYSLTLAICLYCAGHDRVEIWWGKMPQAAEPEKWVGHLWVEVGGRRLDLAARSHGGKEEPKDKYFDTGSIRIGF